MSASEGGSNQRRGIELEKFKRRLIRSVARRMREKKSDQDVWEDMKKEIGSNCKKLWERMRMLTLKKLKRLLEADDRVDLIGPVARMTLTDWLLFDLVIVHEKIDVIDREKMLTGHTSKVLLNLLSLVQRFEIEGRSGEDLAEAWTAATVYYNSKGHQCSPMMLQRRWYQIKELTRHKFYKFWFNYRGNQRKLIDAKQDSPDDLQKTIALKYPHIITNQFLSWEEGIEKRLVILPDELGVKMRQKNLMKPSDTNVPDVVLVEPHIETIDLGTISDSEDEETENDASDQPPSLVAIKREPVDTDDQLDAEYEPYIPPEKGSEFDEEIERLQMAEDQFEDAPLQDNLANSEVLINPEATADDSEEEAPSNEAQDIEGNDNSFVDSDSHTDETSNVLRNDETIVIDDDDDDEQVAAGSNIDTSNEVIAQISSVASVGVKVENVDDVIERNRTDIGGSSKEMFPVISTITSAGIKVERNLAIPSDAVDSDVMASIEDAAVSLDQSDEVTEVLPVISTVSSQCVEMESLDITEALQRELSKTKNLYGNVNFNKDTSDVEENDGENNDLKEFGDVPMDLNFAHEGLNFADDGIAYVEDDEEDAITAEDQSRQSTESESDKKDLKVQNEDALESEEESNDDEETPKKFDLKLLMYPVVYTTKLDAMSIFDDTSHYKQVNDKNLIDKIYNLSKPESNKSVAGFEQVFEVEEENNSNNVNNERASREVDNKGNVSDDDLFNCETIEDSNDSDNESDIIDDSKRVKSTSYMLQKPKHRSYNPVILCKNPDFNTRLKKLSVGFFMSARNRALLQSCIPMTIDMSKAFEDRLINGTLYLKTTPQDSTPSINLNDNVEVTSAALVKPSTVQQSLMTIDNTLENELKKRMAERIRAINLPDISQVRRLNQHLLTAEVTPLRLQNETSQGTKKVGPACYIQNIKNEINNLLSQSQQKQKDVKDIDIIKETVVTDNELPLPTVAVTSVLVAQPVPPMVVVNPAVVDKPHVPITTAPTKSNTNTDDPSTATASGTVKVRKRGRRTIYPTLAWNKVCLKKANTEPHQSDTLLTLDTLYKMLSALDPCTKFNDQQKKKICNKKGNNCSKNVEKQKVEKPKQDAVIDITDDEAPKKQTKSKPRCKSNIISLKDKSYCCWCSYRVDFMNGNVNESILKRRHKCNPDRCVCCCKELYYAGDLASVTTAAKESINLDNTEEKNSQTSENIVKLVNKKVTDSCEVSVQIDLNDDPPDELVSDIPSSKNAVLTKTTPNSLNEASLNNSSDRTEELTPLSSRQKNLNPKILIRVYTEPPTRSNRLNSLTGSSLSTRASTKTYEMFTENSALLPTAIDVNPKGIKTYCKSPRAHPNPAHKRCTCRPNISKVKRGQIEINGKNNCPIHKKIIKENKIVLSKKLITNENQPFFVGKGKILLTNIKMPSKNNEIKFASVAEKATHSVEAVKLPAGVQVILLPDQTLTYIIRPDATLTPEECALLPQFLVALQQQINAVGITLPQDQPLASNVEVINLDIDESLNKTDSNSVANAESAKEVMDTEPKTTEDFEKGVDILAKEKVTTIAENKDNNTEKTASYAVVEKPKNLELEPTNADIGVENPAQNKDSSSKTNEQVSDADEVTNKKSLLSDLMEMSGIMEEDLTPAPFVETPPIVIDTTNLILHREMPHENKSTPTVTPETTSQKPNYIATNKNGNIELSAVTSFAELKYSCDNNGIFFKLDLESGQLNSINVCIQKFPSKLQPNSKSVIDLTDDPDISITGLTDGDSPTANQNSVELNESTSPANKTQITSILQKKQRLMERLSNNLKPVNILQSKKHVARILKRNKTLHKDPQFMFYRKREMEKIETKIDLVDSDAPMEEEYLINSDSSDDEPLIKKVKRKLANNTETASTESDQVDKQGEDTSLNESLNENQNQSNVVENAGEQENQSSDKEQSNASNSEDKTLNSEEDSYYPDLNVDDDEDEEMVDLSQTSATLPPVPTNLVLSGGAFNAHNIPLNTMFRADGDDSQDCILGV